MITKEQFEELTGIELIEENGKLVYYDDLDLEDRKDIIELPDNLKVLGFLDLNESGITKLPKGLEVEDTLDISETDIKELPKDTKFGGSFYANYMNKPFSFPKVMKVEDWFECIDTTIKRMPEELYVKGKCDFSGSTFGNLPKVMEVGESLILQSTPITELPEGLKEVYGYFDISNTKVSKLNDNLVVYNELNLGNTIIEELPKGLIVNEKLEFRKINLKNYSNLHKICTKFIVTEEKYNEIKYTLSEHSIKPYNDFYPNQIVVTFEPNYKGAYLFKNEIGKYIKADGIFGKIVKQKGNVYHIQLGKSEDITYLVTDGEGKWAHGETLKEAKDDLLYKIGERNKGNYKDLSLDSELSFKEAIVCYRVITGACSFGTRDFIENRLDDKKDEYTISEIIELTEGEYGNEVFKEFFCEN